jgi:hypothetical protein
MSHDDAQAAKYICNGCGHVGLEDDFIAIELDPVNDGWHDIARCPECLDENCEPFAGLIVDGVNLKRG